jgi:hypothetical protein
MHLVVRNASPLQGNFALLWDVLTVNFSNPNPVLVSLILQPMFNAQTQFYISD